MTAPSDPVLALRGALSAYVTAHDAIIAAGEQIANEVRVDHTPPTTKNEKGSPNGLPA